VHLAVPFGDWLALPIAMGIASLSALCNAGGRARRSIAVGIATLTAVAPFLASPEQRLLRFACALSTALTIFRALDLFHARPTMTAPRRVWHTLAVFDTRRVTFGAPALDRRALLRVAILGPLAFVSGWLLPALESLPLRWLAGALFAYSTFDAAVHTVVAAHRAFGVTLPRLHDDPILSRTVSEFWGKRWNLVVHAMLLEHCFVPLARRRHAKLGALAAFAASALLHFWVTFAPLDLFWGLVMASFFLVQGAALLLERALGVARWRRPLQHAWAATWVLGTSPLLTEPLLRIFLG
jgi:hypothetical protein